MQYPVQIEQQNGHYHASVLTVPSLSQTASTRDEVLRLIRDDLLEYVRRIDVVYIDIPKSDTSGPETTEATTSTSTEHPWMKFAGMFEEEPLFDDVLEHIHEYREELDEQNDAP